MRGKCYSPFLFSSAIILLLVTQIGAVYAFAQDKKLKYHLPKDNRSLFLWGGLPGEFLQENVGQETAKKFNFRYYRYAGCISPGNWHEDAQNHNRHLRKRIAKEFGEAWEDDYKKEYFRLANLFQRAERILSYDTFFWSGRDGSFAPATDIEQTYYSELHRDSVLRIMLCSTNEWLNNTLLVFREFELNMYTRKVTLIANKPDEIPTAPPPQ